MKGVRLFGHIMLAKSERSELASDEPRVGTHE